MPAKPDLGAPGSDVAPMLCLVAAWLLLWGLTWPVGNFPLMDDWVYALGARSIVETGRFALPSPSASNLFAQAYWGALFCWPFGFSFTALRLSTVVLGTFGVLATYQLLRELGGQRRVALLGAAMLAANPLYLDLSTNFMTDVPFTALSAGSLWLYVRGVQRGSGTAVALALLLAFVAIMVRQLAVVLPFAFGVAHLARKGLSPRAVAIAVLPFAAAVALQVGYSHWLLATGRTPLVPGTLSALAPTHLGYFVHRAAEFAGGSMPYIGLFLAPMLLYLRFAPRLPGEAVDPSQSRWAFWLAGVTAVLLVAAMSVLRIKHLPERGNVIIYSGLGPLSLRDTYLLKVNLPVLPGWAKMLWLALSVAGTWLALLLGAAVTGTGLRMLRQWRGADVWREALLLTLIVVYCGGILTLAVQYGAFFDRYFLFLIAPTASLLLIRRGPAQQVRHHRWRLAPSLVLIGLSALFGVLATHDFLAWNRARWRATDALIQAGTAPNHIDGGYEFNGWNLYNTPTYLTHLQPSNWYWDDDTYMLASGPLAGYTETQRYEYPSWLRQGTGSVLVLHRDNAGPL